MFDRDNSLFRVTQEYSVTAKWETELEWLKRNLDNVEPSERQDLLKEWGFIK